MKEERKQAKHEKQYRSENERKYRRNAEMKAKWRNGGNNRNESRK
jgi:hypothetical protein